MTTVPTTPGKFLDPQAILDQCDVGSSWVAADFGCGPGYFSLPLAKMLSKVISFDVLPSALEAVESKAKISGIDNIETKRVNLEGKKGTGLNDDSIDFVVIKDMLFQNKNKDVVIKEAWRILKPGGIALIVEWGNGDYSIGPDKLLRIPEQKLKEMVQGENFEVGKDIDAGKFHYSFVIKK